MVNGYRKGQDAAGGAVTTVRSELSSDARPSGISRRSDNAAGYYTPLVTNCDEAAADEYV